MWYRRATEARVVAGEDDHGGPERSLCRIVKVRPRLCMRTEDFGKNRKIFAK